MNAELIDQCRQRLKKIAQTKIRTTMIYPLSQFEQAFGKLWGHGIKDEELTDEQSTNRKLWNEIRQRILDMGNKQIRGFNKELDIHNVEYIGYTTVFKIKGSRNADARI